MLAQHTAYIKEKPNNLENKVQFMVWVSDHQGRVKNIHGVSKYTNTHIHSKFSGAEVSLILPSPRPLNFLLVRLTIGKSRPVGYDTGYD